MSPLDYAWIALDFLLCALVSTVPGALATVQGILDHARKLAAARLPVEK